MKMAWYDTHFHDIIEEEEGEGVTSTTTRVAQLCDIHLAQVQSMRCHQVRLQRIRGHQYDQITFKEYYKVYTKKEQD